jgi:hypothetical protein
LIIAPYDGFSDPEMVELHYSEMWIHVLKVPEGYSKEELLKPLIARSCGTVVKLEMIPAGGFRGDFVRARVLHDVRRPLTRVLSFVRGGKRTAFAVKYEKLGLLCYACGLIGRDYKECGEGVFEEKDLKFGEWIYVTPPSSRSRGSVVLRGGGLGGRGGLGRGETMSGRGHGRGGYVDWREHPERKNSVDKDLEETAASPIKKGDVVMAEADGATKRRLAFEEGRGKEDMEENLLALAMVPQEKIVADDVDDSAGRKRYKKEDGTSVSGSAASSADDRREQ